MLDIVSPFGVFSNGVLNICGCFSGIGRKCQWEWRLLGVGRGDNVCIGLAWTCRKVKRRLCRWKKGRIRNVPSRWSMMRHWLFWGCVCQFERECGMPNRKRPQHPLPWNRATAMNMQLKDRRESSPMPRLLLVYRHFSPVSNRFQWGWSSGYSNRHQK